MIHPLKEEVYIAIYLICYGIYIVFTYDIFIFLFNQIKINRLCKTIIELFFAIIQLTITYFFTFKLASGYIPIYFILFFLIGSLIYYLICRKNIYNILNTLNKILKKINLNNFLKSLLFSQTLFNIILNIMPHKRAKKVEIEEHLIKN